ncbi:MAG: polysaccharide deacetylase family protein [Chloroflexota bacterium]|nr:polysaccharide deacetylase family protein [Chloroflexota bacterium]
MQTNPVLKKLGFSDDDRVVIIHTDDIGMCQASVDAYTEMVDFGLISSGAVMVPCPWFLEAAQFAASHPEVDLGVHLTLTSEWDTYRWGPISTRDPNSGLMDKQGFFHKSSEAVWEHADSEAAVAELDTQISRALAEGIPVTHIDTHMGSVAHAKIIPGYVQLAMKYGLPPMIPRISPEELMMTQNVDESTAEMFTEMVGTLEEMGIPLLDAISGLELTEAEDRFEQAKQALSALKPGITHFIIHPSKDTPELRHITDSWDCRVADYETFMSDQIRAFIQNEGIQIIGYRDLKALMPSSQ